jgi:tRNA A-37 threonylcarbamoyl transferase component Bud32
VTTTASELPRPRVPEVTTIDNRFHVKRVLHRGSATATMVATDDVTGADVVVKTARIGALARGTRLRLLHEAEVLRSLEGAGLVPLVAAGESGDLFYLAMPLVGGHTLAERLVEGPLSVPECLRLATDLLSALDTVHSRGILHRDVKPSNVIVTGAPVERATLIDFGLARSSALDETLWDEPVGTARYMSPEQAGLVRREVDERSDLYAAGVVLFEAVTGRPPFAAETVGEVLRQHVATPAPDPRTFGVEMPVALAQIVQRLLRKDPRDRYQSAAGALADVEQLSRALRDGDVDPVIALGLGDRRATLTDPAFVGRRNELGRLLSAANAAAAGGGGVVLLEAESGGGKSRLLDELANRAVDIDTLVLRGQGVDEAARRPFEVLQGVARGLVVAVEHDRALKERLATRLIDERAVLVSALPALREVLGQPDDAELLGPEEFGEARALAAMSRLLDVVGSQQRAAIVLLDDCQWADEQSIRLLDRWQRTAERAHVLVVAAFRAEEVGPADPLRAVSESRVVLPPSALPMCRV